jgi:hypothetical protein
VIHGIAGSGVAGFAGDSGPASEAMEWAPKGCPDAAASCIRRCTTVSWLTPTMRCLSAARVAGRHRGQP